MAKIVKTRQYRVSMQKSTTVMRLSRLKWKLPIMASPTIFKWVLLTGGMKKVGCCVLLHQSSAV